MSEWTESDSKRVKELDEKATEGPPGDWICQTCGFALHKRFLRSSDMAIGIDAREVQDICPNDGSSMRRVTWKEMAEMLQAQLEAALSPVNPEPNDDGD